MAQDNAIRDLVSPDSVVAILKAPFTTTNRAVGVRNIALRGGVVTITLSDGARQLPVTQEQVDTLTSKVRQWTGMPEVSVQLRQQSGPWAGVVLQPDATAGIAPQGSPVRRTDAGWGVGPLAGRNIALWPSHGRYYEQKRNRWEWQRGRLFTTAEDLLTPSYVLPFLIPMLENAGAMALTPRERDTARVSVVVDDADAAFSASLPHKREVVGYAKCDRLKGYANPFLMGKAKIFNMEEGDSLVFSGRAPQDGPAMVYVAYVRDDAACDSVTVEVSHAGGVARYRLNQRMGGSMWMPLGMLPFREGHQWRVVMRGKGMVSADAVRIGGGMGCVERMGETSGLPAWAEGARYYLQSDGFDSLKVVSLSEGANDYTDDVNARGEWVNALMDVKKIPIDLSFAMHTDAGVTHSDSTIGTLCLVTTSKGRESRLPDGRSMLTSRQLAGRVSSQIVSDIRRAWDADWTWRGIEEKNYSESRRPNVPALLLELLSHQNVADMRLGLHPAFRHDVSRSIYKGILRYLAGADAPIAPLPPSAVGLAFADSADMADNAAMLAAADDAPHCGLLRLTWRATPDSIESSAVADSFAVYERGRLVGFTADTSLLVTQRLDGIIRRYHVVAIGPGGRSLPSECVTACLWRGGKRALLVEGMDRLAAPKCYLNPFAEGFSREQDPGVPWHGDIYSTGSQHGFDPNVEWTDNDSPGCGASYADREMVADCGGSTRRPDVSPVAHMMRLAGYSFVSQTKEAFDSDTAKAEPAGLYDFVRIDLDRQCATAYGDSAVRHAIYTAGFCKHVDALVSTGVRMVISGVYVGSDIQDRATRRWCEERLGFRHRTGHASRAMKVTRDGKWLKDNCLVHPAKSGVWERRVDAIEPSQGRAQCVCRYSDSQMSAATQMGNVLVVGF